MPPKRQNIGRRTNNARRSRARRMNESEEEHKRRVESVRLQQSQLRSNETAEQHEARIAPNRIRIALTRSKLSYAGRNLELENKRLRMQLIRSNKIEKLKPITLQCNPKIDYGLHPAENKNKVRMHRKPLKLKDGPPKICCSNGKVKLPVLNPPPEPLITGKDE